MTEYPSWKVGDWAFFEYKLVMVEEVESDGRVSSVSTGHTSCSSLDLRDTMFPLDLRGKCVSEEYEHQYDKLHKESRGANLNFPDIHRWFVAEWVDCMESRHDDKVVDRAFLELRSFVGSILESVAEQRGKAVNGVRVFR